MKQETHTRLMMHGPTNVKLHTSPYVNLILYWQRCRKR